MFVSAHALLTKLSSKQVTAQAGRPVRFCERTVVAVRRARRGRVGKYMLEKILGLGLDLCCVGDG